MSGTRSPPSTAKPAATRTTAACRIHWNAVGDLALAYERLEVAADTGLAIVTYSAEPGSPSEERLRELREWTSTRARLAVVDAPDARLP